MRCQHHDRQRPDVAGSGRHPARYVVAWILGTGATIDSLQYTAFHYGPDHVLSQAIVGPQSLPVLLLPLEDGYVLFTAAPRGGATMQMLDTQGNPVGAVTAVASLPFVARELADGDFVD